MPLHELAGGGRRSDPRASEAGDFDGRDQVEIEVSDVAGRVDLLEQVLVLEGDLIRRADVDAGRVREDEAEAGDRRIGEQLADDFDH